MDLVLQSFRLLIADLCQQFNMGHPGGAIGMAAIGVALFKYTMKLAPKQPTWFNRDRFLLSNGKLATLGVDCAKPEQDMSASSNTSTTTSSATMR